MSVAALIGIVISIVVGVALLPVVLDTLETAKGEENSETINSLIDFLPIVFISVIIIGAVGFIAYAVGDDGGSSKPKKKKEKLEKHKESLETTLSVPKFDKDDLKPIGYNDEMELAERELDKLVQTVRAEVSQEKQTWTKTKKKGEDWVKEEAFGTQDNLRKRLKKRLGGR